MQTKTATVLVAIVMVVGVVAGQGVVQHKAQGKSAINADLVDGLDASAFALKTGSTFTDNISMDGNQINDVGQPQAPSDAVPRKYVDLNQIGNLSKTLSINNNAGDNDINMSGNDIVAIGSLGGKNSIAVGSPLDLSGNQITDVGDSFGPSDVVDKQYVDTSDDINPINADLVAGNGLTGGNNNVLPGSDSDVTVSLAADDLDGQGNIDDFSAASDLSSGGDISDSSVQNAELDLANGLTVAGGSAGDGTQSGFEVDSDGNIYVSGSLNLPGDINTVNAQEIDGSIIPDADATLNLGSQQNRYSDLYLADNIYDTNGNSPFFDGGCNEDQYITGITSTGQIQCSSEPDDNTQNPINADLVAGSGLAGGEDNVLPGGNSDVTVSLNAEDLDSQGNIDDFSAASDLNQNGDITSFDDASDLNSNGDISSFDNANDLDAAGDVSSLSDVNTDDLSEGSSNQYHTDERAQDAVGTILEDGGATTVSYDDGGNSITISSTDNVEDDQDLNEVLSDGTDASGKHIDVDAVEVDSDSDYSKLYVYGGQAGANDDEYSIGMHNNMGYGPLNDWATTFTMNNQNDRGWVFRDTAMGTGGGAMALDTVGNMRLNGDLAIEGSIDETADVAEVMEKRDSDEEIEAGDVVAVKQGEVTKNTSGSTLNMVVSAKPGVRLGGQVSQKLSQEEQERLEEKRLDIAFTGRVPTKILGGAESGDYVMPSGGNNGTAVAVPEEEIGFQEYKEAVGVVLERFKVPEHMSKNNTEEYREVLREAEGKDYQIYNVAVGVK